MIRENGANQREDFDEVKIRLWVTQEGMDDIGDITKLIGGNLEQESDVFVPRPKQQLEIRQIETGRFQGLFDQCTFGAMSELMQWTAITPTEQIGNERFLWEKCYMVVVEMHSEGQKFWNAFFPGPDARTTKSSEKKGLQRVSNLAQAFCEVRVRPENETKDFALFQRVACVTLTLAV